MLTVRRHAAAEGVDAAELKPEAAPEPDLKAEQYQGCESEPGAGAAGFVIEGADKLGTLSGEKQDVENEGDKKHRPALAERPPDGSQRSPTSCHIFLPYGKIMILSIGGSGGCVVYAPAGGTFSMTTD
ncbi:hypothetical protein [Taklimakanibacter albus]|uniref:Uncharacterized protein n=1 Tax=Taklimakanibacter albus TaxID=2800327 RepID=A0ACC5R5G7_9HYPH|nr:hypothetical protein [Aestuariivirga sp. YIM B02566]MBK1867869.1 hypothetical protein [Aestuariivirga sp. YIM B02566]